MNPSNILPTHPHPFGMLTPGRNWSAGSEYRFGFNGKESDSETSGEGNIYDYGFRIYNPRLGKFLSVDPLTQSYPWYTPYQFAGNKPIAAIDLDGLEENIQISLNYDLLKGNTQIKKDQYNHKFKNEGFLGSGTLFVDANFIQQGENQFSISIVHSYAEVNTKDQFESFQILNYFEFNVNKDEALAFREFLKHFRNYNNLDLDNMSLIEEWLVVNSDQPQLVELAEAFSGPQSAWSNRQEESNKKHSSGVFDRDISFIGSKDTTYSTNDKGDTTNFRVPGKKGSRSEGAFMEYKYKAKNEVNE